MLHQIETSKLQSVLDYLISKPYKEVATLIEYIKSATPVQQPTQVQENATEANSQQ